MNSEDNTNNEFNHNIEEKNEGYEKRSVKKETRKDKIVNEILEWIFAIVIALVFAFLIKYFVGTFTTVKQVSMYPTLNSEEKLWLDRTIRTFNGKYKKGDIVTFEAPSGVDNIETGAYIVTNESPKAKYRERNNIIEEFNEGFLELNKISYIKRVIATEGDRVQIKDGKVYVNGEELKEKYLPEGTTTKSTILKDFVVPKGHYFLMGDNRDKSTDSRALGCIPHEKMEGKVLTRIWPLTKIGSIGE